MSALHAMVIDEHPVVRRGVTGIIRGSWEAATVSEAATLEEASAAVNGAKIDLLVIDPWRAGSGVGDLVEKLHARFEAPIVIFTADVGARLLTESLRAGARGYVRKDSRPEDLARALEAATKGEHYVDPSLSSTIVLDDTDRSLSARQVEILQMLANGMQTDAVAQALGLSTETVRTHAKRILAKLEASTRTQAVAIGLRHGLID